MALLMLILLGARERTEAEFRTLLDAAHRRSRLLCIDGHGDR
jgi:hypothetical protein